MNANQSRCYKFTRSSGFTLIEMIVGIVAFAVALTILTSVFSPQVKKGLDPIWQTRAVALSKSLFAEISALGFDEFSAGNGQNERCNESVSCTTSSALGPDAGESRGSYDDIDDYHGLVLDDSAIVGLLGGSIEFNGHDVFSGFQASIQVFYDQNQDGINDDDLNQDGTLDSGTLIANRKMVQVVVVTPDNEAIEFASYRDNY